MDSMAGSAVAIALGQTIHAAAPGERPNVLVLQPDQHRGTIMGCAGDAQAITPNLDRLAASGIRFSRAVSASPVCSPFRGTFQTGLYPHKHGVTSNDLLLDPGIKGFAEVFARAGYATGYIGKWHLDGGTPKKEGGEGLTPKGVGGVVPPERRHGWQEWNGYEKAHEYFEVWKYNAEGKKVRVKGYDWEPTWQADVALDFIKRHSAEKKPWLYYLAFGPPHVPEKCPERYLSMYDPAKFLLPPDLAGRLSEKDEADVRNLWQMYYAQVTAVDYEVGRLLDGLKALDVDDNTIILYTSDHGDLLANHWPGSGGGKPGGAQKPPKPKGAKDENDGEYEGEPPERGKMRGKGAPYAAAFRIPLIIRWPARVKQGQVCDALASSVDLAPTVLDLAGLPPLAGMQGHSMAGWCLRGDGPRAEAVWVGLGGWRVAWDGRYLYAHGGKYQLLYDHQTDPHEMKNLFNDPAHQKDKERMHRLLVELSLQAEDPLSSELKSISLTSKE